MQRFEAGHKAGTRDEERIRAGHSLERFPLVAAGAAATEGAVEGKVDVLLAVHAHHEGGHIHNLLAHPVMTHPTPISALSSLNTATGGHSKERAIAVYATAHVRIMC